MQMRRAGEKTALARMTEPRSRRNLDANAEREKSEREREESVREITEAIERRQREERRGEVRELWLCYAMMKGREHVC